MSEPTRRPIALIVEDRPEIAKLWQLNLEPLQIESVHVTNLADAYLILERIPPPDLVLLDLNLGPTERAEYTVSQISKMKSYNPSMVVIVISGVLTEEIAQMAVANGAQGVRQKVDMRHQVDLWMEIESSLAKVPTNARLIFDHSLELLEQLTKRLYFL